MDAYGDNDRRRLLLYDFDALVEQSTACAVSPGIHCKSSPSDPKDDLDPTLNACHSPAWNLVVFDLHMAATLLPLSVRVPNWPRIRGGNCGQPGVVLFLRKSCSNLAEQELVGPVNSTLRPTAATQSQLATTLD